MEKSYQDQLDVFMEERYAMKPADGSIFDQIKAMNSPPPSSDKNEDCKTCSSARLQNLAACAKKTQQDLERRKRSTSGKIVPNSFMHCKKLLPNISCVFESNQFEEAHVTANLLSVSGCLSLKILQKHEVVIISKTGSLWAVSNCANRKQQKN